MSKYSHRGYEHRNGGYGRRRHKASGFKKKRSGGAALKGLVGITLAAAVVTLGYLFADNLLPFVDSFEFNKSSSDSDLSEPSASAPSGNNVRETPDGAYSPLASGSYDAVDKDVFVSNGSGFVRFKGIDTTAKNYSAVLNSVSSSLPQSVKIYSVVIPTNTEFALDGRLDGSYSQKDNISVIAASLSDRVTSVDAYGALLEHKDEYIYYRTDECMTSLGAYYIYEKAAKTIGADVKMIYSLETLGEKSGIIDDFAGSFITRTTDKTKQPQGNPELAKSLDRITYYKLPVHYDCYSIDPSTGDRTETDLFDAEKSASDPLGIFPGKDTAHLRIYNLQSSNTDKLLIVKDHEAEPLIGYLIPHFSEIYVADARLYSGNLEELVNEYGITHLMFINGIADANSSYYCQRLRDLFDNSISN